MILSNNTKISESGVPYKSIVFDEDAKLPGVLKNPNQLREAVIYEYMSHKDETTIRSFVRSPEAKAMIEAGTITYDTLDRLSQKVHQDHHMLNTAVCHVAEENGDELFQELLQHRAEERRIINELLDKYRSDVEPLADKAQAEIIDKCIPSAFK